MTRALAIAFGAAVLLGACTHPEPPRTHAVVAGPPAPAFTLPDLTGAPRTLASFRGRPVIVTFWATWCGPCREELPTLIALARRLSLGPDRIVAISVDRDPAALAGYLARTPLPFTVLSDPDGAVERAYGVSTIPAGFVLDAEGRVVERVDGSTDWNGAALRDLLDPLFRREAS